MNGLYYVREGDVKYGPFTWSSASRAIAQFYPNGAIIPADQSIPHYVIASKATLSGVWPFCLPAMAPLVNGPIWRFQPMPPVPSLPYHQTPIMAALAHPGPSWPIPLSYPNPFSPFAAPYPTIQHPMQSPCQLFDRSSAKISQCETQQLPCQPYSVQTPFVTH